MAKGEKEKPTTITKIDTPITLVETERDGNHHDHDEHHDTHTDNDKDNDNDNSSDNDSDIVHNGQQVGEAIINKQEDLVVTAALGEASDSILEPSPVSPVSQELSSQDGTNTDTDTTETELAIQQNTENGSPQIKHDTTTNTIQSESNTHNNISHDNHYYDDESDSKTMPKKSQQSQDLEGIALLRQIFPDLPPDELKELHAQNLVKRRSPSSPPPPPTESNTDTDTDTKTSFRSSFRTSPRPTSKLGQYIWKQTLQMTEESLRWRPIELGYEFLRLPKEIAVQRYNSKNGKHYYLMVDHLHIQVISAHYRYIHQQQQQEQKNHQHQQMQQGYRSVAELSLDSDCYSKAIYQDFDNGEFKSGLGMTLSEEAGWVWVHSLVMNDGTRIFQAPKDITYGGPAVRAGVHPGDCVLGINGQALLPVHAGIGRNLLQEAVNSVQFSENPVVITFKRVRRDKTHPLVKKQDLVKAKNPTTGPSLLDLSTMSSDIIATSEPIKPPPPRIHPFINALARKGLLHDNQEKLLCTQRLQQFTERARQWESFASFRLDAQSYELRSHFDPKDLSPALSAFDDHNGGPNTAEEKSYGSSTPTLHPEIDQIPPEFLCLEGAKNRKSSKTRQSSEATQLQNKFPGWRNTPKSRPHSDIVIPLMGVRKALCARIVNTFLEGARQAYTIWCYDVESGREWYAPIRYLVDFQDLRRVVVPICPTLAQVTFPAQRWGIFGGREAAESKIVRTEKCRQLEFFLRRLCSLIYTDRLHPIITEIAIHVQSFLGCDSGFHEEHQLHLQHHVTLNEAMCWQMPEKDHNNKQMQVRLKLKRAIQRYTYRLFLLDEVQTLVNKFVDATRARGPTMTDIEMIEGRGRHKLKQRAMQDLQIVQAFLDQMQTIVLEGCYSDFESISERLDFVALQPFTQGGKGKAYLERVIREAVREQVEIEVYVPLRGVVSRLLVNGWRHDDMEIHFKMQELRRRPQTMFRIPEKIQSASGWSSVASILNEGVGMSTLPCAKLRAIVDSAKEIMRVHTEEHRDDEISTELAADDFLPIFIYCVARAEMERPCALCVLLTTLCEPTNRIGEIGYYLATFEAAITHIQEVDLAEK